MRWMLGLIFVAMLIPLQGVAQKNTSSTAKDRSDFAHYTLSGEAFGTESVVSASQMLQTYQNLQVGDSIEVTLNTRVNTVCKSKGCWMTLDLGDKEEAMVKFKDYAFFVPKDIEGKDVLVHGKAYITQMSVKDQRHYAEDGGASKEEIEGITQPKRTLSFLADGVLIESELEKRNN